MAIVITPEDIAARINGYQLSDKSVPSLDTVEVIIAEDLAYVNMLVASKGVIVNAGSPQETYLRGLVIRLVASKIELMRNRQTSSFASDMETKAMSEIDAFLNRAANFASADIGNTDKPKGPDFRCNRRKSIVQRWKDDGKL